MDQSIKTLMMQELHLYSRDPINGRSYLTTTPNSDVYAVIGIARLDNKPIVGADLVVEWHDEMIIVHHDSYSIPFYESLVDAGIPRERIILAYAGETIPESKSTQE